LDDVKLRPIEVVGYFELSTGCPSRPEPWHTVDMPKRLSRDANQAAFQMVRRSTGTDEFKGQAQPRQGRPTSSEISRVMAAMGRYGAQGREDRREAAPRNDDPGRTPQSGSEDPLGQARKEITVLAGNGLRNLN
jgi:hypothetical protein